MTNLQTMPELPKDTETCKENERLRSELRRSEESRRVLRSLVVRWYEAFCSKHADFHEWEAPCSELLAASRLLREDWIREERTVDESRKARGYASVLCAGEERASKRWGYTLTGGIVPEGEV